MISREVVSVVPLISADTTVGNALDTLEDKEHELGIVIDEGTPAGLLTIDEISQAGKTDKTMTIGDLLQDKPEPVVLDAEQSLEAVGYSLDQHGIIVVEDYSGSLENFSGKVLGVVASGLPGGPGISPTWICPKSGDEERESPYGPPICPKHGVPMIPK